MTTISHIAVCPATDYARRGTGRDMPASPAVSYRAVPGSSDVSRGGFQAVAMRVLLILSLMFASAIMGPAVSAHEVHEAHHSHSMDRHQGDDPGGRRDNDKAHAVAHVCPGCALVDQQVVSEFSPVPIMLPKLPAVPPLLASIEANPIPPPPRVA
jgi:hypothetical protein